MKAKEEKQGDFTSVEFGNPLPKILTNKRSVLQPDEADPSWNTKKLTDGRYSQSSKFTVI